jgi:hypothetical protein
VWNTVFGGAEGYFLSAMRRAGQAPEVRLRDASRLIAIVGEWQDVPHTRTIVLLQCCCSIRPTTPIYTLRHQTMPQTSFINRASDSRYKQRCHGFRTPSAEHPAWLGEGR